MGKVGGGVGTELEQERNGEGARERQGPRVHGDVTTI